MFQNPKRNPQRNPGIQRLSRNGEGRERTGNSTRLHRVGVRLPSGCSWRAVGGALAIDVRPNVVGVEGRGKVVLHNRWVGADKVSSLQGASDLFRH